MGQEVSINRPPTVVPTESGGLVFSGGNPFPWIATIQHIRHDHEIYDSVSFSNSRLIRCIITVMCVDKFALEAGRHWISFVFLDLGTESDFLYLGLCVCICIWASLIPRAQPSSTLTTLLGSARDFLVYCRITGCAMVGRFGPVWSYIYFGLWAVLVGHWVSGIWDWLHTYSHTMDGSSRLGIVVTGLIDVLSCLTET